MWQWFTDCSSLSTEWMVSSEPLQERRRKRRLPAKEGCLITLGNDPIKPWQILDVSEEGLAFRYIGGEEDTRAISSLDILTHDTILCIEKIPFEVVSDLKMPGLPLQRYSLNRCSGRFGKLTEEQMALLATLLSQYTSVLPGVLDEGLHSGSPQSCTA